MKCIGLLIFVVAISTSYAIKPNCNNCITIAEIGKQILASGITAEQLKALGALGVTLVPAIARPYFPKFVDSVHKSLYDVIVVKNTSPEEICNVVKLC